MIRFTPKQIEVVESADENRVTLVSACIHSGKTTLARYLFNKYAPLCTTIYVAPTHRQVHQHPTDDFCVTQEDFMNMGGLHDPNMTVIMDEAWSMGEGAWEMAEALTVGRTSRLIAIGTPNIFIGKAYRRLPGYPTINIRFKDCSGVPKLISKETVSFYQDRFGEGSPELNTAILGEFV